MINKVTIENAWRQNPNKSYHVIQNPKIDKANKKILGLPIKSVEYTVRNWDKDYVYLERKDKESDKRFPEILVFDKRFADAENEVFSERVSKAKKKPDYIDSYGIFTDEKQAKYQKLLRLHRLATDLAGLYKVLKNDQENVCPGCLHDTNCGDTCSSSCNSDVCPSKQVEDAKKEPSKESIDISMDEIKGYFNSIQETNYFDELDKIQSENPDLAAM